MENLLDEYKQKSKTGYIKLLKKEHPEEFAAALRWDDKFNLNSSTDAQLLYNYYNKIIEIPACIVCGKPTHFGRIRRGVYGYTTTCSRECSRLDYKKYEKIKNTCLAKYGSISPLSNSVVRNKIKETIRSVYGCDYIGQNPDIKKKIENTIEQRYGKDRSLIVHKIQQTLNKKYGVSSPMLIAGSKEKIKQTNKQKYGVEWNSQSDLVKINMKKTFIKKYGVDNPFKSKEIREKIKQSNIKKYGKEWSVQSDVVRNKIKETNNAKYGVDCVFENKEIYKKARDAKLRKTNGIDVCLQKLLEYRKIENENIYNNIIENQTDFILLTPKNDFHGISGENTWKCKKCGLIFTKKGYANANLHCSCCGQSSPQYQLYLYIKSIDPTAEINVQTELDGKLEIDIYIKDKKIGFEYNGLYWHSDVFLDKNYHRNKFLSAKKHGIRLIQIYEDEWKNKSTIIKNKIRYLLGQIHQKIYARKCSCIPIDASVGKRFLDKYHIQGSDNAKYYYGLFYRRYLVAVCSLYEERKNSGIWILSRYATIASRSIDGGFSKLLSYVLKNSSIKEIKTFADSRLSDGNLYLKCGFQLDHTIRPSYYYIKGNRRIHKFNLRKEDFKKNGLIFNENMTEKELATINGFHRIYDCGMTCYVLRNEKRETN